jgi:hypothetical protein
MAMTQARADVSSSEPTLSELFADLTQGVKTLVKQEAHLAKLEMSEKLGAVGRDAAIIGIGGSLLYAGFLALIASAVAGLATAADLPVWGAALIVALLCVVIGGILTGMGAAALKRQSLKPAQTISTLKEDAQWARQQMS